jgi:hypothetical protein
MTLLEWIDTWCTDEEEAMEVLHYYIAFIWRRRRLT